MFSIAFKRPLVTLAVVSGLLVAAAPAGAQGGGADFTRFLVDGPYSAKPASVTVHSPKDQLSGIHVRDVGQGSDGHRAVSDGTSNTLLVAEVAAPKPAGTAFVVDGPLTVKPGTQLEYCVRVGDDPNVIASGAVKPVRDYPVAPLACDAASKDPLFLLSSAVGTQSP
jgi:hypothetical protein